LIIGANGGQLELLSKNQLYEIHMASLDVLEKVGMFFESSEVLKLLEDAGAYVDYKTKIAKIPRYLVEEAVRKAPKSIMLCGRNPKYDVRLEGKRVYIAGASGGVYVLDFDRKRRPGTLKDLEKITRLEDYLENVHVVPTAIVPQDVPKLGLYTKAYEIIVENTEKHAFHEAENMNDLKTQLKMAATVVGGEDELRKRPIISYINCLVSPLKANKRFLEILTGCAKFGVPVSIETDPQMGGLSPVTLIGTMIQINAEVLGGITLAQLINPGTPVIYAHAATTMGLQAKSIGACEGAPERGLLHVATAQLTRYYGIPSCCVAPTTDSKSIDVQNGYEKALTFLMTALAGINLIHSGIGMIDSCITVSYEQFVTDNELAGMVFRIIRGIEIPEGSIEESLDVISKVGPLGSHYLSQKHTKKYLKIEHWIPEVTVRGGWELWMEAGAKNTRELAKEKAEKIIAEHYPEPLPKETKEEIKRIIKEAFKNPNSYNH